MSVFESKVRQVGSSFGLLIPKEIVVEDKLKKDESIKVAIIKKDHSLIKKAFGSVKTRPFEREHKDKVI